MIRKLISITLKWNIINDILIFYTFEVVFSKFNNNYTVYFWVRKYAAQKGGRFLIYVQNLRHNESK